MFKQSTCSRQAVRAFRRELGQLLIQSRTDKNLSLQNVSEIAGMPISFIHKMEQGKVQLVHMWCILKLFRFYGKKIRLIIEDKPPKPS